MRAYEIRYNVSYDRERTTRERVLRTLRERFVTYEKDAFKVAK